MKAAATPIAGLHEIADRFDHVLLDQWGALHEGQPVFPAARDCVLKLRAAGKRVLVLSNSGRPSAINLQRLSGLGLEPDIYDGMLTSGEVAWVGLRDRSESPFRDLGRNVFLITRGGDRSVVEGLGLAVTGIAAADFILLAGLDDARAEPDGWRDVMTAAAARKLPMLCANPDLTMFDAAGGLIPAPGSLARFYASLGGKVAYVGKPHAPIFAAALRRLGDPDPARVIVIGDSLNHDVAGGRGMGLLTLLLTAGIHKEALRGVPDVAAAVRELAGNEAKAPHWIMERLAW